MAPRKKRETLATRYEINNTLEVGIDEAGRGSFWGPLMAAAVIWPDESAWTEAHRKLAPQIQDSKVISKVKRPLLANEIKKLAVATAIGRVEAAEIDKLGITWANREAFRRALQGVMDQVDSSSVKYTVLIDGILSIEDNEEYYSYVNIVDGDAKYLSIAAASILAKVAHDEAIRSWCEANKEVAVQYDLLSSMGYGTARHREAIKTFGTLDDHRMCFLKKTLNIGSGCLIVDD